MKKICSPRSIFLPFQFSPLPSHLYASSLCQIPDTNTSMIMKSNIFMKAYIRVSSRKYHQSHVTSQSLKRKFKDELLSSSSPLETASTRTSPVQEEKENKTFNPFSFMFERVGDQLTLGEETELLKKITAAKEQLENTESTKEKLQILQELGSYYSKLYDHEKALHYRQQLLDLVQDVYGPISQEAVDTLTDIRHLLLAQQKYQAAIQIQEQIIDLKVKLNPALSRMKSSISGITAEEEISLTKSFIEDWYILGECFSKVGQAGHAQTNFLKCEKIISSLCKNNVLSLTQSQSTTDKKLRYLYMKSTIKLANELYKLKRFDDAVMWYNKILTSNFAIIQQYTDDPQTPNEETIEISDAYLSAGNCCMHKGEINNAENFYTNGIKMIELVAKRDSNGQSKKLAKLLYSLSVMYATKQEGQDRIALQFAEKALKLFNQEEKKIAGELEKNKTKNQINNEMLSIQQQISQCYMVIGTLYTRQNNLEQAEKTLRTALGYINPLFSQFENAQQIPLVYSRDVGFIYMELARIISDKNHNESKDMFTKALNILKACSEPKNVRHILADCYFYFATHCFNNAELDEAHDLVDKGHDVYTTLYVEENMCLPLMAESALLLGRTCFHKEDHYRSMKSLAEAVSFFCLNHAGKEAIMLEAMNFLKRVCNTYNAILEKKLSSLNMVPTEKLSHDEQIRRFTTVDSKTNEYHEIESLQSAISVTWRDSVTKVRLCEIKHNKKILPPEFVAE